jgi:hypothetical protein
MKGEEKSAHPSQTAQGAGTPSHKVGKAKPIVLKIVDMSTFEVIL